MSVFKDSKNVGKTSLKQIKNDLIERTGDALHGKTDDLFNSLKAAFTANNNFIHTRDFYNFIKQRSGQNVPANFYYFSVNFYNYANDVDLKTGAFHDHSFFIKNIGEFSRFRYCIQGISFPELIIKGGFSSRS